MKALVRTLSVASLVCIVAQSGCISPTGNSTNASVSLSGPPVNLVVNGHEAIPVVLFADAPPLTRTAAEELVQYIEKISGARPELIEGRPDPLPEHAIWVGYQPVLDTLFPKLDFDFAHPEEILLAANGQHVVVAGRDRWDPEQMVITGRKININGRQQEYGTANAVYTFLERCLDVRWLWPGELGEDILQRSTISLKPFLYTYHPQIRARQGLFTFSRLGLDSGYGHSQDWVLHQRLRLDSLGLHGGHAFTTWWERFGETHPDYFALQPDGTRSGHPNARTVKMCQSNPQVWQQWLRDVEAALEHDPNNTVFSAAPNDGWASGHCICENCRASDHPDGELRTFRWAGLSQQYVALSDRHVTFANHCARLLKERYPDRDYYVSTISYGHSRPPPIEAVPDDNVIVLSVANFFGRSDNKDRGSTRGTLHRDQYAAWAAVAPHIMWRPNTGSPVGWQQGQPDVPITKTIEDFKMVASKGCMGIFVDGIWEFWATQGPLYYIIGKLTWDPSQDAQAVLADYYRRGFGPAAGEIEAYWKLMEETRERRYAGEGSYPDVYDEEMFDKAYALLDRAATRVAGAGDRYGKRVAFVRAGLDFTQLMIENRALMARYRASGQSDTAAADKVRANWDEIEKIAEAWPHGINWGPIRPMKTPRVKGLHPDQV